jgi:phosphoglycerate-specific signal transduction histidine kinase
MAKIHKNLENKIEAAAKLLADLKKKQEELELIRQDRRMKLAGQVMLRLIEAGQPVLDPLAAMDAALTKAKDRELFGLALRPAAVDAVEPAVVGR